jgi:hypothetical protein
VSEIETKKNMTDSFSVEYSPHRKANIHRQTDKQIHRQTDKQLSSNQTNE